MANKKVLLVDDSSTSRVTYRLLITQKTSYAVETAGNGEEAVSKAVTERPDLILMDVVMPKMNGLAAAQALKNDERTKHIPIVLLSFRSGEEAMERGFASGCDEYLIKPIDPGELLQVLEKYLGYDVRANDPASGR
jgi:CheY-like chemotaxis protein